MKNLLDFRLPPFLRINWVNQRARIAWEERLTKAVNGWNAIEWHSVVQGVREVALLEWPKDKEAPALPPEFDFVLLPVQQENLPGPPMAQAAAFGKPAAIRALEIAWRESDAQTIGTLLGYPDCCIKHFIEVYGNDRLWYAPWAWQKQAEQSFDGAMPFSNLYLKVAGLQLTPHIACSHDCEATKKLANEYMKVAIDAGLEDVWKDMHQILSWPVQWSALHGIAEIKTPLFRISHDVAATGSKYQTRITGGTVPVDAPQGIAFPFSMVGQRKVRDSKGWEVGLEHAQPKKLDVDITEAVKTMEQRGPQLPAVNWGRVALPQADGYDTALILELANMRFPQWQKARQTPVPNHFLEGAIGLQQLRFKENEHPLGSDFGNAPLEHPVYAETERLLKAWPEAYHQTRALVHTLHPASYSHLGPEQWHEVTGSCSHCFEFEFGVVHASVHDAVALAQALVHEMAHMKLFALGFWKESSGHLLLNDVKEGYDGTVRTDKPRPMSAILHAQYSFIHVIALDLAMLNIAASEAEYEHIMALLERNVPRMEKGHLTLEKHARMDANGKAFMDSFMPWSRQMIDQGYAVLKQTVNR